MLNSNAMLHKQQRAQQEAATGQQFPVGTKFIKRGTKRNDICTVTDYLTTTNLAGETVNRRYVATYEFCGQIIKYDDICATTISLNLIM